MSLNAQQRRDQRRRLVVSWKRDAAPAAADAPPRAMASYDPEAHPERLPGPATRLPTGWGGLTLAALAILLPVVGALAVATSGPLLGRPLLVGGGRFAGTVTAAADCLDPRGVASLQGWLAQVCLVVAAGVALVVRQMRRHRRDDYKGRFRAWGWLAALFMVASCAGALPVGRLVSAALADATGLMPGPGGIGWWIGLASLAFAVIAPWAVLPLHERAATASWLVLALVAWGAAAAAAWLGAGRDEILIAGQSAWCLGAALAAVAMLAAARSVIREIRGLCTAPAARKAGGKPARSQPVPVPEPTDDEADDRAATAALASDEDTEYVDGSEPEHRHLSKAERKRLRKLARMNGSAA